MNPVDVLIAIIAMFAAIFTLAQICLKLEHDDSAEKIIEEAFGYEREFHVIPGLILLFLCAAYFFLTR